MARPRLSADQAALTGALRVNPARFTERQKAPPTIGVVGPAPKHLSANEKKVWREISNAIPEGIAGKADRFALEMCSRLLQQFRTDPDMQASRIAVLLQLLSRLGLEPQARTKLQVAEKPAVKQDDEWSAIIN